MNNPYSNLFKMLVCYGKPWRKGIMLYCLAYVVAQICLSFSPYAFGRTIDILQNFKPQRLHEVIGWLLVNIFVMLLFWLFHRPARIKERDIAINV